jgi:hypothetical protein
MESANLERLAVSRCARLRWKGLYVQVTPDPTVPLSNDQLFWCNQTQTCLGPDGRQVDESSCKAGRTCYERL